MKKLIKIISFIIVTVLVSSTILPVSIYASSAMAGNENNAQVLGEKTGAEDITIVLANEEPLRNTIGSIANIPLVIDVYNSSYIKDASIIFENSNFNIVKDEIATDKNIQSITDNTIKLNSSEIDEKINLTIPVSFRKQEYVPEDYFNKTVTIKLVGTYVNKNGEEKTFEKTTQADVLWSSGKKIIAEAELVRSFTFTENNKENVMVTVKITSGTENAVIPERGKRIKINIPKINNIYPQVIVAANDYTSQEDSGAGLLTLTKEPIQNSNNEYKWSDEKDSIYVTYVYKDVNNAFYTDTKEVGFKVSIGRFGDSHVWDATESNKVTIPTSKNNEIQNILISTATSTPTINRGYIVSNANIETNFDVQYLLNIGYPQMTSSIKLKESQNQDSSLYKTKSISVNRDELISVLGDEGKITISFKDSNDTYEISKNNTTITVPEGKEINEIVTSQPVNAGNLSINTVKTLDPTAKDELASKTKIVGQATITNVDSSNDQISTTSTWETKIEEPTQKVHFESQFKTLSTMKKNEKIAMSVILESDSVDDYLFKNPKLTITYPEEVEKISNVTVNVLYDDNNELRGNVNPKIDEENHKLILELSGTQTSYITSAVSKGILIQIVADYTLNRLSPTKDEKIQLEVQNANTGVTTSLEKSFKIVAPTQFIMQNKMGIVGMISGFSESRTTIEEDVEDINLPLYSDEKYMTVTGTIVNNQGVDLNNVIIAGNFPSTNTNAYSGEQFNNTFDTTLVRGILVDNKKVITEEEMQSGEIDNETYKIYYSGNANESIASDNWTEKVTEEVLKNAKSYKIVFNGKFKNTESKTIIYYVKIPADLGYNEKVKETFTLMYPNGSISGEQYSSVEAKPIGASTKSEADFSVSMSLKDSFTGREIRNGETVNEGQYLDLKVSTTNVSSRRINNVKVIVALKDYLHKVETYKDGVTHYSISYSIEEEIGQLNPSETKITSYKLYVDSITSEEEKYTNMEVQIYEAEDISFKTEEFKNKINDKKIAGIIVSTADNKEVGINDTFEQYICVRNLTDADLTNIEIKGVLPKAIEYNQEKNDSINVDGLTYSYDASSREYKIVIEKLTALKIVTGIRVHLKTAEYGEYQIKAKATADGEEYNFNSTNVTVAGKARHFEVSHTISSQTKAFKDTDTFYFNITIKNRWDEEKLVVFKDRLDDNFVIQESVILQNGEVISKHKNINLIDYNFRLQPEEVAEIRIKCGLRTQSKESTINLTHSPTATCERVNIFINPITITVTGTGNFVNTNNPVINGKYTVSGVAWLDANNDGKREKTEQRIANVKMKLIDNNTKKVFVDDINNEKVTQTNENGEYIFTNIPVGSYVVVAYYDANNYGCGDYQNKRVAEDLNNDFIETTFEDTIVGTTDNIIIQNTNADAIDLSLIPRDTFDMALEKNVTNISISSSKGKEANYKFNSDVAKVELSNEKDVKYYLIIEYTLKVKNIGYIDGYAKSLIDYVPKGMTFVQEDNPGWYIKSDGYAYNDTLVNTLIKAQKQTEVKIKLRKEITAEQTGIIKNAAEIGETYNIEGIEDINSRGANKDTSENDYAEAIVVIALSTGGEIIKFAGIVFGILALGSVVLLVVKRKKKKII